MLMLRRQFTAALGFYRAMYSIVSIRFSNHGKLEQCAYVRSENKLQNYVYIPFAEFYAFFYF